MNHLQLSIIKAAQIPGHMVSTGAVVKIEVGGPIKMAEPFHLVGDRVRMDDVHDHGYTGSLGLVD